VCVATKAMSIGQIFSVSFFPSSPFLLAAGGAKGIVAVWDVAADGGDTPTGAPPAPPAARAADETSATARRFATRLVDAAAVPTLQMRPRRDGQALA